MFGFRGICLPVRPRYDRCIGTEARLHARATVRQTAV